MFKPKKERLRRLHGGIRMGGKPSKTSLPDKPLVSVITVCLNSEKYLEQTIQSVLGQTYDNIEYIIIDGGSTDKTPDIIKKYENRIAYWVSEPDKGIYDAMNKGMLLANGDFLGIINGDDWYFPDAIEKVVGEYNKYRAPGVIYGNMAVADNMVSGSEFKKIRSNADFLPVRYSIFHEAIFLTKEIYRKYKYSLRFKIAADYELMLRLFKRGVPFRHVDHTLFFFRTGGTSANSFQQAREYFLLLKRHSYRNALRRMAPEFYSLVNYHCYCYRQKIFENLLNGSRDGMIFRFYQKCKRLFKYPKNA